MDAALDVGLESLESLLATTTKQMLLYKVCYVILVLLSSNFVCLSPDSLNSSSY